MGLVLFPGDDDNSSPDVAWSCTGFAVFRGWLAQAEGFDLDEMHGFGGLRSWSDVVTPLAPLLDHPDVGGPDLSPLECAAMLPRVEEIADQCQERGQDRLVQEHITYARNLAIVLRFCIDKDVDLLFG